MPHLVRSAERAIVLAAIFALAACAPGRAPESRSATPAPPVAVTARATPASTAPVPEPTLAATDRPTAEAMLTRTEEAALFGPAWGDREVYRAGLVSSEKPTLDRLHGASEYRIKLEIDGSLTRVRGQQQVRYTNREGEPLQEVYLRLFPNALGGKMSVKDVTVDGLGVMPEYEYERTAIRVPLPAPLAPGESTVVGLDYDIVVPESLDTGYGLLSVTDGVLALDTPYAPIPVYDESGWNVETPPENADTSFNDASLYLVEVTAPEDLTVVASGVEVGQERGNRTVTTTYALGPARDFYLSASQGYSAASKQVGETRINSYALPGEERARDAALDAAADAVQVYSRLLGPYPYTELDLAATPMLALGIEYPGAVGISRRVYDPSENEGALSGALESTVAHETAHQWFYNVVGSDQIDEPWLDEAITQYATWLYFADRYGQAGADGWRETWGSRWDRVDREQKPVGLPAREYSRREYGSIVYGRGPLFVEALAEKMGQEKFEAFLGKYARQFRWGIATADDFKQLAEEACNCQLDDLYKEWLEP